MSISLAKKSAPVGESRERRFPAIPPPLADGIILFGNFVPAGFVVVGVVDAFHEDFAGTEFVEGRFSGKAVRKSSRATAKKLCALPMNIF